MKRLLIGTLFLLSACALNPVNTTNGTFNSTQAGKDIVLITNELPIIATIIEKLAGTDEATKAKVAADLVLAQDAAKQIAVATSNAGAQPYVLAFETSVNAMLSAAGNMTQIPEPYLSIIQAVSVILPVVDAAVNTGVIGAPISTNNILTPDQARLILKGATVALPNGNLGLTPTQARLILQGTTVK